MPQPFPSFKHVKNTSMGIDACADRPGHMLAVMRIIAAAAYADHWFGNILIGITKDRKEDLAKLYNGFESDAKKTSSFEATATAVLHTDMHEQLHLIVKAYRTVMKLRHPFAHCRYGWTPDDHDLLLLINPRNELVHRAERETLQVNKPKTDEEKVVWFAALENSAEKFESSMMCYRLGELEKIRTQIEAVTQCFTDFWNLTANSPPDEIRAQISAQLTQRLHEMGG